jgi:hypothetical protein
MNYVPWLFLFASDRTSIFACHSLTRIFLLLQVIRHDSINIRGTDGSKDAPMFTPAQPREKWMKRRTTIKLRVGIYLLSSDHYKDNKLLGNCPFEENRTGLFETAFSLPYLCVMSTGHN